MPRVGMDPFKIWTPLGGKPWGVLHLGFWMGWFPGVSIQLEGPCIPNSYIILTFELTFLAVKIVDFPMPP